MPVTSLSREKCRERRRISITEINIEHKKYRAQEINSMGNTEHRNQTAKEIKITEIKQQRKYRTQELNSKGNTEHRN